MFDGFILLSKYNMEWEVHIIKNMLEANGIRIVVEKSYMASRFPLATVFYHKIYVYKPDFEEALDLMNEFKKTKEFSVKFAEPVKSEEYSDFKSEEYNDFNDEDENIDPDEVLKEPYYQEDLSPTISKDLITAKVDDEYNPDKIYKCPNCEDEYLVKIKMADGVKFLFSVNYIVMAIIVISYISGQSDAGFIKIIKNLLPENIIIMIIHIYILLSVKFRCEKCGHSERH
ncbi:MAG: DUF2007 domain-containing protein [Planctomycetes bacterium]|nr:DUF2007 domain-containing protein [Planctomycetota bacterium]